jgi:pre-mRNA-processing factor 40
LGLKLTRSPTPPVRSSSPEHLRPSNNNALAAYSARQRETSTPTSKPKPVEQVVIPPGGFTTHEKAEEAFIYLLKRDGVDETWTWDQTMRKIIMDPLYKALETLAQKKAAFEKVSHL